MESCCFNAFISARRLCSIASSQLQTNTWYYTVIMKSFYAWSAPLDQWSAQPVYVNNKLNMKATASDESTSLPTIDHVIALSLTRDSLQHQCCHPLPPPSQQQTSDNFTNYLV